MKTLFKNYTTTAPKEEYIWVEGYKGMDKDMKCTVTTFSSLNNIYLMPKDVTEQYQLNVETSLPENETPESGSLGFHFCLTPQDTLAYYPFNFKNRYFKVRAYVKKKDFEAEKRNRTNFAAKKIIPYEEFFWSYDDILLHSRSSLQLRYGNYEYLYTEEDFDNRYFKHKAESEVFRENFIHKITKYYDYSAELIEFIYALHSSSPAELMYYADLANVLGAESISRDARTQILLSNILDTTKLNTKGRK